MVNFKALLPDEAVPVIDDHSDAAASPPADPAADPAADTFDTWSFRLSIEYYPAADTFDTLSF
jgi:hypothetical protein